MKRINVFGISRAAMSLLALMFLYTQATLIGAQSAVNGGVAVPVVKTVSADGSGYFQPKAKATMALLETTDVHAHALSYDYAKDAADQSVGFERTATLISQARAEFPNNLLLDDGDTIQGTALGDYQAAGNPVGCSQTLAMYKIMNYLRFDAGTIGNHEFNYGLPYLNQVTGSTFDVDGVSNGAMPCAGPVFPMVLANLYSAKTNAPLFKPYEIITRMLTATGPNGSAVHVPIKIGIIGFTTPTIMVWDKPRLEGKVYTQGIVEAAAQYIPEMRSKGAEIVIALSHGGLDNSPYSPTMENGSWYLSKVAGIDALLVGHSHLIFPDATSTQPQFNLPGVDKVKGTVNGVPTVMANFWGKSLGVIKLQLVYNGNHWIVDTAGTSVEVRNIVNADKTYVAADPAVAPLVAAENISTLAYVRAPIAIAAFNINSYFADIGDTTAIEVVNQAQTDYVQKYVAANLPQYKDLPVLSVSAPFKDGFAGGGDFADIPAMGNVTLSNAFNLQPLPSTLAAVRVQGSDIKNWLELASQRYSQIDPTKTTPQELRNSGFPNTRADTFTSTDVSYEIDVTQPVGARIKKLTYKGAAMDSNAYFIVATNSYDLDTTYFPDINDSKVIYAAPDASLEIVTNYIKQAGTLTRAANASDRSWRFTKVVTAGLITFKSAPGKLSAAIADGLTNISVVNNDDGGGKGLADYAIDLSK